MIYAVSYIFRPMLFIGPTGTGKSAYVQQMLMKNLPKERYIPTFVNFSAQTSANQTQVCNNASPNARKH